MSGLGSDPGDSPSIEGCQTTTSLLHPLAQFYVRAGWALPIVERIPETAVPASVQPVLVHQREMTVGLERHYGAPVGIRVLARMHADDVYARQVLLTSTVDDTPWALAAVEIRLDTLPPPACAAVLAEVTPLGRIMRRECPTVRRVHRDYFRLRPDTHIQRALNLPDTHWTYGRRGTLTDASERPIADIIEVLPPNFTQT